jgi:yeast amino acid transporter
LTTYIGIAIFLVIYLGHKFIFARNEPWIHTAAKVDLKSGLSEVESDAEMWTNTERDQKEAYGMQKSVWKKFTLLWE